jgi:hypothetical protein
VGISLFDNFDIDVEGTRFRHYKPFGQFECEFDFETLPALTPAGHTIDVVFNCIGYAARGKCTSEFGVIYGDESYDSWYGELRSF